MPAHPSPFAPLMEIMRDAVYFAARRCVAQGAQEEANKLNTAWLDLAAALEAAAREQPEIPPEIQQQIELAWTDERERFIAFLLAREAARERPQDVRGIIEALGFDPTNHHNALKCPYCTPQPERERPTAETPDLHGQIMNLPSKPKGYGEQSQD